MGEADEEMHRTDEAKRTRGECYSGRQRLFNQKEVTERGTGIS